MDWGDAVQRVEFGSAFVQLPGRARARRIRAQIFGKARRTWRCFGTDLTFTFSGLVEELFAVRNSLGVQQHFFSLRICGATKKRGISYARPLSPLSLSNFRYTDIMDFFLLELSQFLREAGLGLAL